MLHCRTCHQEIAGLLTRQEGYHGKVANRAKGDLDCARCHTEHYGRNFQIFQWPTSKEEFDHKTTGYPLLGAHAGLACEKCHNPNHISAADRKHIMMKDLSRSFDGLHPACLTCHEDRHKGQLGADCERCHDVIKWKPAKSFDHATTKYPLTGRHQNVACEKCHPPLASDAKAIQYTGLDFATCTPCHQDPHKGAFVARCESCHNTDSWRRLTSTSAFDHSKTKFPLNGKHADVGCLKCHVDSNFKTPVAHEKCMDCHKDEHKGQFQHRTDGGECRSCHTEDAWKPSTFTEASHRNSAYPITGKHQGVACAKCHLGKGADVNYHPAFKACQDCHKDPHGAQFTSPQVKACEDCHNVNGFQPSLYTMSEHQKSSFPLKGAHAAVACQDCHQKNGVPAGADRQFHFGSLACVTCHRDPHAGEFPDAIAKAALPAGQDQCESCHGLRSWQELKPFDHSTTTFRLEGSHAVLRCVDCHRPANPEAVQRDLPFKAAPERCEGCHEDIHAGQFRRGTEVSDCGECHDVSHWTANRFDHNSASTFSLKGAHEQVPCKLCHTERKPVSGRDVVIYKGTPRECAACHR